jgi:D-3-phosphoglycerate dehydrogenase / 2-oxoglutarate reductase
MPTNIQPVVLITEPLADTPRAWLSRHARVIEHDIIKADRARLESSLAQAHALIVRTYTIVDQALLDQAPNLRVVARAGVGLDNIDLNACKARGIAVVHTPKANTHAVVEYTIAMILRTLRPITPIAPADHPLEPAQWAALRARAITPKSCAGAKLGIIGLGSIGSALAIAADALGMHLFYHDIASPLPPPLPSGRACTSLGIDELARTSEIISVHVDGRESNRHLLSDSFFSQLKPDCILLNTSRGFVIDEHAAARFAVENPSATLILDVHANEPIASDSPFDRLDNTLPNVIRTPHIAAATEHAKEQMSWVVRDVIAVLNNHPPAFPATPPQ